MFIKYKLTMPNAGSWNGQWSGASTEYAQVRRYYKKNSQDKIDKVLKESSYGYDFKDGWYARVYVEVVDAKEKNRVRKAQCSFCGYNWMIDSIERFGKIVDPQKVESSEAKVEEALFNVMRGARWEASRTYFHEEHRSVKKQVIQNGFEVVAAVERFTDDTCKYDLTFRDKHWRGKAIKFIDRTAQDAEIAAARADFAIEIVTYLLSKED